MHAELLDFLFDRPEKAGEWFFDEDHEDPEISSEEFVAFSSELFADIATIQGRYSDHQLAMGFRYLVDGVCSPFPYSFLDNAVPVQARVQAIEGMANVFRHVFAIRCLPVLMRTQEPSGVSALPSICYMWWHAFPWHGVPYSSKSKPIDDAVISVLEQTLRFESLACKESAIHGLGHWQLARPDDVTRILGGAVTTLPLSLAQYAADAVRGHVQ